MNTDAVRAALLDDARAQADGIRRQAKADKTRMLAAARREAELITARARSEGREAAQTQTSQQRARLRREAHQQVLQAQQGAYDLVRERLNQALARRKGDAALTSALTQLARSQLGEHASITCDAKVGGIVAHNGTRSVDYRLPTLAERLLRESRADVQRVWQ